MLQADQSPTTQRATVNEERDSSNANIAREHFVLPDWASFLPLAEMTSVPQSTSVRDADENAATLPGHQLDADNLSRVLNFPPQPVLEAPTVTLHALQEWEGYVLDIVATDFIARLVDMTAGSSHEGEEAVIPLAEISEDDAKGMRPGSIFRWVIGYERSSAGTKKRVSHIVFRDLPVMTKADLLDGEAWAQELIQSFEL